MKACPCGSRGGNPVLDPCIRRDDNKHVYLFKLRVLAISCIFIFCFEGSAGPCEETFDSLIRTPAVTTPERYSVRSSVWKISAQGSRGTGFFIAPNKLVTNLHVISVLLRDVSKIEDITLSQEGNARTLKIKGILAMSALHDLALLETTGSVDHYLPIRRKPLQEQEDLFSTGYPHGQLTDIRKTSDRLMFSEGTISFFVNRFVLNGLSGAPAVDAKKQVVGVLFASAFNLVQSVNLNDLQMFVQASLRDIPSNNPRQVIQREIENLRTLAKKKNTHAQFRLGIMYAEGKGVSQNFERAFHWYKQAAEKGHAEAQFRLGVMYHKGEGVSQNFERAFLWYTKAAEQGDVNAQFNLGVIYKEGEGVSQNFERAFHWYKLAAEKGHVEAQFNLGVMYYKGEGVSQNFERAFHWYKLAAEQGYVDAQFNLGLMYKEGEGVSQNFERAFLWFKQAEE